MLIPFIRFKRIENFSGERSIHNLAHFLQRGCGSSRQNLYSDIANRRSFNWSGQHSSTGSIRCELIQKAILRSASDDSNLLDTFSAYLLQVPKNETVLE